MRTTLTYVSLTMLLGPALYCRPAAAPPDFSREVRPILSENCFKCHGQDKAKHHLRLDLRAAALKGGKSELPAIVPGKPQDSELIERVTSTDEDEVMPPPDTHKKLSPAQIDTLSRWIMSGAEYQPHWAFIAPVRPALPKVHDSRWPRDPIDRFVLARLEHEGLSPSRPTDAVTLCRRLYLDLVGLPPTPHEVDSFSAAYARSHDAAVGALVDKLLASPQYGEKWAQPWLDAARYADSNGYEKDRQRIVWPYRDYVIDALNHDMPYDRFIIEQIAGDLLPHPTPEQITATGFLRLSMLNEEGAVDPEQFRMAGMFDRVDAVGKSILGLTIACAQCHNHKYDPLTQQEYYRLFAFLNNDHDATPPFYLPEQRRAIEGLRGEMDRLEAGMRVKLPDWRERLVRWEDERRAAEPAWETLELENIGDHAQRYERKPDGSFLAGGWAPSLLKAQFKATPALRRITAFRLEVLTDPDLPAGGPGRSEKGTFALSEFVVRTSPEIEPSPDEAAAGKDAAAGPDKATTHVPPQLKFASVTGDIEMPRADLEARFRSEPGYVVGPASFAADEDVKTAWSNDIGPGLRNADRAVVFRLAEPLALPDGAAIYVTLLQLHGGFDNQALGRFRVCAADSEAPPKVVLSNSVIAAIATPRERRTADQDELIFNTWRGSVTEWKEENKQLAGLWEKWPEYTTTYALQARDQPRVTSVLERGDWLKPLRPVQPGLPAFLHPPPPNADGSRLTLARWLADPKSPLTARVFVNRVWQAYFGVGLVATPEDFGLQGQLPSNPALLDWLACEFMKPTEPGVAPWSIKHLQRLIAKSATYRQSSRVTPEMFARDPENRLLARGPRFRADSEEIRDIALASSGLLNPKMGGRSVMPPAPADLFKPPASYEPFPWVVEQGEEKYRRAIYTFRRRSTLYPMLQTFDTPNGDISCVRRLRSNTPLQALTLLNEPVFMDCAVALARHTLEDADQNDGARVTQAFRRVVSRAPDRDELAALLSLLNRQRQRYASGELDAAGMFPANEPPPLGASTADWAALTIVSRAILNLDESITKE